jgi:hypothetical protein
VKVPYGEGLADHTGPESCGDDPRGRGEALTGVGVGRPLSREKGHLQGADAVHAVEGKTEGCVKRVLLRPCVVEDPGMRVSSLEREPRDLWPDRRGCAGPHWEGEEP